MSSRWLVWNEGAPVTDTVSRCRERRRSRTTHSSATTERTPVRTLSLVRFTWWWWTYQESRHSMRHGSSTSTQWSWSRTQQLTDRTETNKIKHIEQDKANRCLRRDDRIQNQSHFGTQTSLVGKGCKRNCTTLMSNSIIPLTATRYKASKCCVLVFPGMPFSVACTSDCNICGIRRIIIGRGHIRAIEDRITAFVANVQLMKVSGIHLEHHMWDSYAVIPVNVSIQVQVHTILVE